MFWIILLCIIWLIMAIIFVVSLVKLWFDVGFIMFFLACFSPLLLFIFPENQITDNTPIQEIEKIEICAMNDGSQIYGRSFLFSQTVREELVYKYLTKDADGGLSVHTIPSSDVKVYADLKENNKGYIITYKQEAETTFWRLGAIKRFTEIHIPESSVITNDFIVDLQ